MGCKDAGGLAGQQPWSRGSAYAAPCPPRKLPLSSPSSTVSWTLVSTPASMCTCKGRALPFAAHSPASPAKGQCHLQNLFTPHALCLGRHDLLIQVNGVVRNGADGLVRHLCCNGTHTRKAGRTLRRFKSSAGGGVDAGALNNQLMLQISPAGSAAGEGRVKARCHRRGLAATACACVHACMHAWMGWAWPGTPPSPGAPCAMPCIPGHQGLGFRPS